MTFIELTEQGRSILLVIGVALLVITCLCSILTILKRPAAARSGPSSEEDVEVLVEQRNTIIKHTVASISSFFSDDFSEEYQYKDNISCDNIGYDRNMVTIIIPSAGYTIRLFFIWDKNYIKVDYNSVTNDCNSISKRFRIKHGYTNLSAIEHFILTVDKKLMKKNNDK